MDRLLLVVLPREGAQEAIEQHPDWGLLSIFDVGHKPLPRRTSGPRLDLEFDDLDRIPQGIDHGYRPPRLEDAEAIIQFAREIHRQRPEGVVVHCHAGVSRSAAAALGILCALRGTGGGQLVRELQRALWEGKHRGWREDEGCLPNARLVALFDRALGCGGALLREVFGPGGYRSRSIPDIVRDAQS